MPVARPLLPRVASGFVCLVAGASVASLRSAGAAASGLRLGRSGASTHRRRAPFPPREATHDARAAMAAYFRSGRSGISCWRRSTSVKPAFTRCSAKTSTGQW